MCVELNVYVCMYVCMYVCVYIYIWVYFSMIFTLCNIHFINIFSYPLYMVGKKIYIYRFVYLLHLLILRTVRDARLLLLFVHPCDL